MQPEIQSRTPWSDSPCASITNSTPILSDKNSGNEIPWQIKSEYPLTTTLPLRDVLQFRDREEGTGTVDIINICCSLVSSVPRQESCSCASMSRVSRVGDQSLYPWISGALHTFRKEHLVDRTGSWLFESDGFKRWHRKPNPSLLCINGSPGTGKSMLTTAVINHLQAQRRHGDLVAYYFCDGRFKNSNVVVNILWVMLSELLSQTPAGDLRNRLQGLLATLSSIENRLSLSMLKFLFSEIKHSLKNPNQTLFWFLMGWTRLKGFRADLGVICGNFWT